MNPIQPITSANSTVGSGLARRVEHNLPKVLSTKPEPQKGGGNTIFTAFGFGPDAIQVSSNQ